MTSVLILNNSGDVLFQSSLKPLEQQQNFTEANRIRFLPLLLIKDLTKANFHDRIHYLHSGNKTIAFLEKQSILYVAWAARQTIPAELLQEQLWIIHRFLKFHFGPEWHSLVENATRTAVRWKGSSYLSLSAIATCLARLPFLATEPPLLPLYSPDIMGCVEQVELHEDLRARLTECLRECCNTAFAAATHPDRPARLSSIFSSPTTLRKGHYPGGGSRGLFSDSSSLSTAPLSNWTHSLLFAREKIVTKCLNEEDDDYFSQTNQLSNDLLYFIKNLAVEYVDQIAHNGQLDTHARDSTPMSESSSSDSYSSGGNIPLELSPTPQPSLSETASQRSSLTYDASSLTAPFKIKEKSASSVTLSSSTCSTPSISWSSPPRIAQHQQQLLSRLSRRSMEHPLRYEMDDAIPPNMRRTPSLTRRRLSASPKPIDSNMPSADDAVQLPPNAKAHHPLHTFSDDRPVTASSGLSSSVPVETVDFGRIGKTYAAQTSAPSSPATQSRRNSYTDRALNKQSLRHLLSSFLNADDPFNNSDPLPIGEGKVVWRWMKTAAVASDEGRTQHHQMVLCSILLLCVGGGLCVAVVNARETRSKKHDTAEEMLTTTLRSQYYTSIAKTLRAALQEHLQDFSDFLLTKEATHFTILSFLPAYPGLVHFIHVQDGIMIAPRIVDLNEMNQQHGQVLLEAGQKYYEEWQMEESKLGLWDWPSVSKLQALCEDMLRTVPRRRAGDPAELEICLLDRDRSGFQCVYQHGSQGESLVALYFSFVPRQVLLDMHQRLFQDVSQRILR